MTASVFSASISRLRYHYFFGIITILALKGGVGVDRSKIRREVVPNRGASMPKTTRREQS